MYSATGPASDRSALVVVTDRANSSAVGGNARWRSPEVAEEVLMRTSERTRAGWPGASRCASTPPAETPTTCAAVTPQASSTPAASAARLATMDPGRPGGVGNRAADVAVVMAGHEPRGGVEHGGLSAGAWLLLPAEMPVWLPGWRQASSPASHVRGVSRRAGAGDTGSARHPCRVVTSARQASYWPRPASRKSGRPARRSGPWSRAGTCTRIRSPPPTGRRRTP